MTAQKSVFITGAASGIGRAAARLFAGKGWFVGCFDVNAAGLADLEAELGSSAGLFHALDVSDRAAVLAAVAAFGAATGGQMDMLFSNAGIDAKGPFADTPWDRIMAVTNVNLIGAMSLIHAAIPLLTATQGALCLSTASASAIFGTANMAVYSATKHAVKGLTEALSVELATHGVRAADLLPGIIDTGMLLPEQKAMLPKEGMWRALPAEAVAQAAWDAYEGTKLHYYVPEELAAFDVAITTHPETVRDERIAGKLI